MRTSLSTTALGHGRIRHGWIVAAIAITVALIAGVTATRLLAGHTAPAGISRATPGSVSRDLPGATDSTPPAVRTAVVPSASPLCSARTPYTDAVLSSPMPVSYWRLGETSGTKACDSVGASSGLYRHGFVLDRPGLIVKDANTSLALDGLSGYVNIPSAPALNPTSSFSGEAWVAPSTVSTSQTVLRKDDQYLLRVLGDSLFFRIWWSDGTITELTSPSALLPGESQHVVASYDGMAMRLYLNGTEIASKAADKTMDTTANPLLIGQSGGYDYFRGRLDEVAVYAMPLPATKVANHSLAGHAGREGTPGP